MFLRGRTLTVPGSSGLVYAMQLFKGKGIERFAGAFITLFAELETKMTKSVVRSCRVPLPRLLHIGVYTCILAREGNYQRTNFFPLR